MKRVFSAIVFLTILGLFTGVEEGLAQQDPQFTHYIYNQQTINPAYAGSRGTLSVVGLHRTQWVSLDGAPNTSTLGLHSPIGKSERIGLGFNVQRDEIFITNETYIDVDFSYTIDVSYKGKLAFGLKAGAQLLDVNISETTAFQQGDILASSASNIDNQFAPQVGVGLFYSTDKFYFGASAPNLLQTEHFELSDNDNETSSVSLAEERIHYFFSSGYVFDLSDRVKFKPAGIVRAVSGAPLGIDLTANFLLYDKLTLGAAYRVSAAFSGLVGFQISDSLLLGFSYDRETTELRRFNDGSYEFFLRYEVFKGAKRLISPRFF